MLRFSVLVVLTLAVFAVLDPDSARGNLDVHDFKLQDPIPELGATFGGDPNAGGPAAGDVNGDGKDDLIVGAARSNVDIGPGCPCPNAGQVFVFLGGNPFSSSADFTLEDPEPEAYAEFGAELAVGDFDGDEFDDIIVGAPFSNVDTGPGCPCTDAGQVFVFLGDDSFDTIPDATLQDPEPNPDPSDGIPTGTRFGLALAAGDVRADPLDRDEIIVGAPCSDVGPEASFPGDCEGEVFVFVSPLIVTTLRDTLPEDLAQFGRDVAAGDVNGDGKDEVIVGSWRHDGLGGGDAGRVFMFWGGSEFDTIADFILDVFPPEAGAQFGRSLAVGDVDGDNLDDVIVGADSSDVGGVTNAGQAFVFLGATLLSASLDPPPPYDPPPDFALQDPVPESGGSFGLDAAFFGRSVAAGDLDGDGWDDVIIGAPGSDILKAPDCSPVPCDNAGEAFVFLGGSLFDETADFTLQDPVREPDAWFGDQLVTGDVNGDALGDALATAYLSDVAAPSCSPTCADAGEAFLFLGHTLDGKPIDVGSGVTVSFEDMKSFGITTVTASGSCTAPGGFQVSTGSLCYDIDTTTSFNDSAEVCVTYDDTGMTDEEEALLQLLHDEDDNGSVEANEVITSSRDELANVICGKVASFSLFFTATLIPDQDFDQDGCSNAAEAQNDPGRQAAGGLRDPQAFWDFFDTPNLNTTPQRDKAISVGDIVRVVQRVGTSGDPNIDPLSTPPQAGYHTAYDRTVEGPNSWNLGPPDGAIAAADISAVVNQFGHSCVAAP